MGPRFPHTLQQSQIPGRFAAGKHNIRIVEFSNEDIPRLFPDLMAAYVKSPENLPGRLLFHANEKYVCHGRISLPNPPFRREARRGAAEASVEYLSDRKRVL